jgi:MoaA/NifB/PqqE/SkfB family radical SAM enzyme
MKCSHCLRGNAQCLNISNEIINRVLDQISYMSSVTFTGGDPSLNVPAIEHFTDAIRMRRIGPEDFYVVTNGKKNATKLASALINLFAIIGADVRNEVTALCMSRDPFHEQVPIPNIFRALTFFQEEGHVMKDTHNLINEGRAKQWQMGTREVEVRPFENTDGYEEDTFYVSESLYIAANGNVISACDLSYKRIDAESFGNVLETPLLDILQAHTIHEEAIAA